MIQVAEDVSLACLSSASLLQHAVEVSPSQQVGGPQVGGPQVGGPQVGGLQGALGQ